MNKHLTGYIAIALSLGLSACGTNTLNNSKQDVSRFDFDDKQIIMISPSGDKTPVWRSDTEIEALAQSGSTLMWGQGESPELWKGKPSQGLVNGVKLASLDHDIDAICFAPIEKGVEDVFISDGDGRIFHYWLRDKASPALIPVRQLNSNPDIKSCVLSESQLYLKDPYLGVLKLDRNPENDGILRPANHTADKVYASALKHDEISASTRLKPNNTLPHVTANMETASVENHGDAADDPAILVWQDSSFWIAGTDKQRGLRMYNQHGEQIHFQPRGRINNVDAVALDSDRYLLAASNRTAKSIDLYVAQQSNNQLKFLRAIPLTLDDPYGLCMGKDALGNINVFVGDSEKVVEHWRLNKTATNQQRLHSYYFDSQTEGCVYAADENVLYVGQEDKGIWRIALDNKEKSLLESIETGDLIADVEGLDIYHDPQRGPLLIASSQGDDSYIIYSINPWQQLLKFKIGPDYLRGIDGSSETDGLAVTSLPLNGYQKGALIVQDGRNRSPQANQNFKLIDWQKLEALLPPIASPTVSN
jgi:3-phytase